MAVTISAEQFKKKYGQKGIERFALPPQQPGYVSRVGSNLKNTFMGGAKGIIQDVSNTGNVAEKAGGDILAKTLAVGSTAGHIVGRVAGTAGGIIGSFIEPALPESAKQKIGDVAGFIDERIQSIPGMTPEIHHALGDVFNTVSLLSGGKATTVAKNTGIRTANTVKTAAIQGAEKTKDLVKAVGEKVPQFSERAAELLASEPGQQVKTILQETPRGKFDDYLVVAQESMADPRKISVFEKVGDSLTQATEQIKKQTSSIGAQKSAIIQKARVGLQEFTEAPRKALLKIMKLEKNPLSNEIITKLKSVRTKLDADKFIDEVQAMIYDAKGTGLIAKGSKFEKQMRGVLGEMNEALKKSLPKAYRDLNTKFATRTKVLNVLNRSLGEVVEGVPVRGASLIKQFFSPSGSKAKELFEFIKKNTGVDLAQDATLAKFMGDLFNDPKVRSLLEGVPSSRSSFIDKVVDVVAEKSGAVEKFQNIKRKVTAEKARKLTK